MRVNPVVFFTSAGVILLFVLVAVGFGLAGKLEPLNEILSSVSSWIITNFGWFYVLVATGFLAFSLWLFVSRFGSIKLGKDEDEPEYSLLTWFAMLFSAGMGIGLLFYSVAEPMTHFYMPPPGGPEALSQAAAKQAMVRTFFHWGLHAWAIYIVLGLSLAYFAYRHDLPLTIRSCLYPLLGQRIYGRFGDVIEIIAVFGTLFGVATSLGLGALQISAGLESAGILGTGAAENQVVHVVLITLITLAATASVVSGLNVGIRRLSEVNMVLGLLLILFVFLAGPTLLLLNAFVQNTGSYLGSLVPMSFDTMAYQGDQGASWQGGWTMFYWGWWISWSPFVGMFIARISKGRTIRAFIGGVLLVPTMLAFFWLSVFGNAALELEHNPAAVIGKEAVEQRIAAAPDGSTSTFTQLVPLNEEEQAAFAADPAAVPGVIVDADGTPYKNERTLRPAPTHLFELLKSLPLAIITMLIATLVIATFFITSSDSASLVIDILTSGGDPEPPVWQRIFWAITEGAVAATLLIVGGSATLAALQAAAITTALPFSIVMVFICIALVRGLRREHKHPRLRGLGYRIGRPNPPTLVEAKAAVAHEPPEAAEPDWRARLKHIADARLPEPADGRATRQAHDALAAFIGEVVAPAFAEIQAELEAQGRAVTLRQSSHSAEINVRYDGDVEFSYAIRGRAHHGMSFVFPVMADPKSPWVYNAAVVVDGDKRSDHPLDSFTKETIIEDFLREYATWKGW